MDKILVPLSLAALYTICTIECGFSFAFPLSVWIFFLQSNSVFLNSIKLISIDLSAMNLVQLSS